MVASPGDLLSQVLTGRVTSDGAPLLGANVRIQGTTIGTSTDADGRYRLALDAGTYEVLFTLVGYASKSESITIAPAEQSEMNVELKAEILKGQEVVVVGGRSSTRTVTDSPLPIDILSQQDISNTGQSSFDKVLSTAFLRSTQCKHLSTMRQLCWTPGKSGTWG